MACQPLCDASEALNCGPGAGKPVSSLHAGQYTPSVRVCGYPAFSFAKDGKGGRFGVGFPASFLAQ